MYVITLASQKGGTGKSTIATNLAIAASLRKYKTAIIDLDPQQTAYLWATRRPKKGAALKVVDAQPASLAFKLQELEGEGVDLVFIDTPGNADVASRAAVSVADLVLSPLETTSFSVQSLPHVQQWLATAGDAPVYVVLNKISPSATKGPAMVAKMIEQGMGMKVAPVHICLRSLFGDAPADGLSVIEMQAKGKAQKEIVQLFDFCINEMNAAKTTVKKPQQKKKRA